METPPLPRRTRITPASRARGTTLTGQCAPSSTGLWFVLDRVMRVLQTLPDELMSHSPRGADARYRALRQGKTGVAAGSIPKRGQAHVNVEGGGRDSSSRS